MLQVLSRSARSAGSFTRLPSLRRMHDSAKQKDFADIVICGGGLIGLCQAIAIGSNAHFANRRVILLESQQEKKSNRPQSTSTSGFSNRVVALNLSSVDLLKKIGVWQSLESKRVGTVRRMRVFDGCSDAAINFDLPADVETSGSEALCYIAEVPALLEALSARLQTVPNVSVLYDAKVTRLHFDWLLRDDSDAHEHGVEVGHNFDSESFCQVDVAGRSPIRCRLLIGADGHNSAVRRLADIHTVTRTHDQAAVVATLRCRADGVSTSARSAEKQSGKGATEVEQVENETAFQRFLPDGPIAVLPLRNSYVSLVWSTSRRHAASLLRLNDAEFVTAVNRAFHSDAQMSPFARTTLQNAEKTVNSIWQRFDPVGKVQSDVTVNFDRLTSTMRQYPPLFEAVDSGSRAAFDLSFVHATHYAKSRFVLIGDAAHRVLPLAGLGMNLGYGDVATLTRTLCEAVRCGADLGDFDYLRRYETERQRFNVPVATSIEALNSIYATSSGPFVALRSLGLSAVNACRPLKHAIIRSAMYGVLSL